MSRDKQQKRGYVPRALNIGMVVGPDIYEHLFEEASSPDAESCWCQSTYFGSRPVMGIFEPMMAVSDRTVYDGHASVNILPFPASCVYDTPAAYEVTRPAPEFQRYL